MIKFLWYWGPVISFLSLIYILSSLPGSSVQLTQDPWTEFIVKKTIHVLSYAMLWLLTYRALTNTTKYSVTASQYLSLALTISYSFIDEFHQTFTPGRNGNLRDVIIDFVGASLMYTFIHHRLFPRQIHNLLKYFDIRS